MVLFSYIRAVSGFLFSITFYVSYCYIDILHWFFSRAGKVPHEMETLTLDYLINVHGRLLFSEKISRIDALIRWWTLINFLAKFQGGRLFHCGRTCGTLINFCKVVCNLRIRMQCFQMYFLNCINALCANNGTITNNAFCNVTVLQHSNFCKDTFLIICSLFHVRHIYCIHPLSFKQ